MDISDIFQGAGGYGVGALLLALASLAASAVLAIAKGMGNWVPAALWLTTPVLALTVAAFGAAQTGQAAALELAAAAPAGQLIIAADAWPDLAAALVLGRVFTGVALLLAAGAILIGHMVCRMQVEQTGDRERQWICARTLLGATLLSGTLCLVTGLSLGQDLAAWGRTGGLSDTPLDGVRLGGLLAVAIGAALLFALALPSWRRLIERRSLIGAALCLLLVSGAVGAEAVAAVERHRIEQVLKAPSPTPEPALDEPAVAPL